MVLNVFAAFLEARNNIPGFPAVRAFNDVREARFSKVFRKKPFQKRRVFNNHNGLVAFRSVRHFQGFVRTKPCFKPDFDQNLLKVYNSDEFFAHPRYPRRQAVLAAVYSGIRLFDILPRNAGNSLNGVDMERGEIIVEICDEVYVPLRIVRFR
jgi:hypothetical protein